MLDGVNDSDRQAKTTYQTAGGNTSKVNLIPFNPFLGPATGHRSGSILASGSPDAGGNHDDDT